MSSRPPRGAARLAAILDALPDALLLVNANGTVVNANSIALEMFESAGTALIGRGLLDLLPGFDSKRIPGSMVRPDEQIEGRQPPTRMMARRTDGSEFPVEVTSANLQDGRTPYESSFEAAFADHGNSYTGDELLMLVVRDLAGTLDTEAELARQQRQTEMILRAAAEGVVGTDTEGRVVLVNPAAATILGYRASDLGGQELHPLVHHSRPDGSPLPYEETPLADTLRSGRKHRVRRQVLWAKDGQPVPVDMTTAPVRDGEQLVGAVLTFADRRAQEAVEARHEQLLAVLDNALRGPLEELRGQLAGLAADPAGQLWPEANQILHYLSAGYARMTTLVDNVMNYQRLDTGRDKLDRKQVALDSVIAAGVEGAVELIGPGRAQFAVHAPPIEAEVDPDRLALAVAHLVADVAGVDATGARVGGGSGDSTIVVAAAQRGGKNEGEDGDAEGGAVVRIEVRGPHSGGNPVHLPIVRGIVRLHGGVLQTHEVPGSAGGSAYVLEVPVGTVVPGAAKERARESETTVMPVPAQPVRGTAEAHAQAAAAAQTGAPATPGTGPTVPEPRGAAEAVPATPTGRRARRALTPVEERTDGSGEAQVQPGTGRRGRRAKPGAEQPAEPRSAFALPPAAADQTPTPAQAQAQTPPPAPAPTPAQAQAQTPPPAPAPAPAATPLQTPVPEQPAPAPIPAPAPAPEPEARPEPQDPRAPAEADRPTGRRRKPSPPEEVEPTPPPPAAQPLPEEVPTAEEPQTALPGQPAQPAPEEHQEPQDPRAAGHVVVAASPILGGDSPRPPAESQPQPLPMPGSESADDTSGTGISVRTLGQGVPLTPHVPEQHAGPQTPPAGTGRRRRLATPPDQQEHSSGQTGQTGQTGQAGQAGQTAQPAQSQSTQPAAQQPAQHQHQQQRPQTQGQGQPQPEAQAPAQAPAQSQPRQQPVLQSANSAPALEAPAREFAIGAPEAGSAEGPEPLDGPNGAVEVTEAAAMTMPLRPIDVDDELPPEPLDNPRRLLVWPEPDVSTQQALTSRGYRPVIVNSREEVDAQIAAYPAALFVDPLTGPITRTALQSLRQAAVAAEVPVLVTAGLGQATREAAYGADPAVLLKALAPRDSEQHPPRVLLVEEQQAIAQAFAATLERRGMQVAHAPTDSDAVQVAEQIRPNLVVMDLLQVRRRRAGIIDWLRINGLLNRTPFVVYTSAGMDPAELPRLASGETVLFLAERSTSSEVQARIVDLLAKIGATAG